MFDKQAVLLILVGVVSLWPRPVRSHGRLFDPPGRSTMWRLGYNTPVNYDDNQLNCGGFWRYRANGDRCGLCGDPYDGVRENEANGRYATGQITNTYVAGRRIEIVVELTANHRGWFEFRVCPTNDPSIKATQECFDRYLLQLGDGSGTRFFIPNVEDFITIRVFLPTDLVCDYCVLQWKYHAGNNWGVDPDGRSCIGCGPQEEFYGCSDIRIKSSPLFPNIKPIPRLPRPRPRPTIPRLPPTNRPTTPPSQPQPPPRDNNPMFGEIDGDNMVCRGTQGRRLLNRWCQLNCQLANCPLELCVCRTAPYPHRYLRPPGCRGAGIFAMTSGVDNWCRTNCALSNCPSSICVC